ncbi:universal stress protein [Candidatus Nitrosocosmicus franklandus]|uniref:universal stress protein n=1 Tax=Candidatus Nitrosocosmicus franklandianus TaxID=1798806 RepID=UPI001558EE63|nr:universal stress protein [Candidatus Nitrosocosmicus franklandus]
MSNQRSKLLLCVDGSDGSLKAARKALEIAKTDGYDIIAIHVLYLPLSISISPLVWEKDYKENLKQVHHWLEDIIIETKNYGINVEVQVQQTDSSIVEKIVDFAKKNKVELIVIGSTGKSKITRMLVGSVAQGVMTYAHCSVLLVR